LLEKHMGRGMLRQMRTMYLAFAVLTVGCVRPFVTFGLTQDAGEGGAGGTVSATGVGGHGGAGHDAGAGGEGAGGKGVGGEGTGGKLASSSSSTSSSSSAASSSASSSSSGASGSSSSGISDAGMDAKFTCSHSLCVEGAALDLTCDMVCVWYICEAAPACCSVGWSNNCISLTQAICHECGG